MKEVDKAKLWEEKGKKGEIRKAFSLASLTRFVTFPPRILVLDSLDDTRLSCEQIGNFRIIKTQVTADPSEGEIPENCEYFHFTHQICHVSSEDTGFGFTR